jgi:hypothetical protein
MYLYLATNSNRAMKRIKRSDEPTWGLIALLLIAIITAPIFIVIDLFRKY